MNETKLDSKWGRVDDDRKVYVRDGDGERLVGEFPDATAEEALSYFVRKYEDLAGQIHLLEQRIAKEKSAASLLDNLNKLEESLATPAAVGDLQALRDRVAKMKARVEELEGKQKAEREEARQQALAKREEIVVEAERLAGQPDDKIRWRETGQAFEELFKAWQESQRNGPHVPKAQADALWKRFRKARNKFDAGRKAYFTELDARNKQVKQDKEEIIKRAEALAPKGADGIRDYQALLQEWKRAGRASKRIDDQLWQRFKTAGDVLYAAQAEVNAKLDEEYGENLKQKEALLVEIETLLKEKDRGVAREKLIRYQTQWDEIGRVPRSALKSVEGRLAAVEAHVKKLEDDHWKSTDPELEARSEGLRGQLEDSIAELEAELSAAKSDKEKTEITQKLETQRSWLKAIDN